MDHLKNIPAVVIGGGSGVGRGVCHGLAEAGAKVVVADIDLEAAARVADEIAIRTRDCVSFEVDSTNVDSLTRLVCFAENRYGNVGVLVNTTGVILERPIHEINASEWQWLWRCNVMSQILSVNAFLPSLRKRGQSHIVLTGSGAGIEAPPKGLNLGGYSVTKHALTGYAKSLRNELASVGIGVTLLCPTRVSGNLATSSAKCYEETIGTPSVPVGGDPPSQRQLIDALELGPLVVSAITQNEFIVSNEPADS